MMKSIFVDYTGTLFVGNLSDDEIRKSAHREYVENLERLLVERDRLLAAIPPCPIHGPQCVPHALGWIEKQKAKEPYCATHGHQWLKLAGYSYCISCGERKENDNGE